MPLNEARRFSGLYTKHSEIALGSAPPNPSPVKNRKMIVCVIFSENGGEYPRPNNLSGACSLISITAFAFTGTALPCYRIDDSLLFFQRFSP